ncbi:glycosyltransferase family 9 protein, partial [bacterium]|nr:glycosyltransferase family 9 protein [bacterium]
YSGIDEVFPIDIKNGNKYKNFLSLLKFIRSGKFDAVISSGTNKFIPVLLFLSGAKIRIGYDSGGLSKLLLTQAVKLNKNQYAADMYHDLVKTITGFEAQLPKIELKSSADWIGVERFKEENSVLIHPGVSKMSVQKGMVKIFGASKWTEIIEGLIQQGKRVFLAGGPDDDIIINQILDGISPNLKSRIINYYGKTKNLYELAQLISKMEVMICSDSAPMHMGVALNTKTVAIFGPTDEKKLLPKNQNFIPVTVNCDCRPCLWEKRQTTCEHLYCLKFDAKNIISYCI